MTNGIGFLLAFVAGFCDTATFVGDRGVFSAHVTGNFVLFAIVLIKGVRQIDYLKIFLFLPFLAAVSFVARMSRVPSLQKRFEPAMLLVASALLIFAGAYFFNVTKLEDNLWDTANLIIALPVIAMGIQNGLYKIVHPTDPMTTVMTGNVIQVMLEAIEYRGAHADRNVRRKKLRATLLLVAGFAAGCLGGAWMVDRYSLGMLIVPGFILLALGFRKWTQSDAARAPGEMKIKH